MNDSCTNNRELELSDLIDAGALQEMMNDYYSLTGIGVGILDLNGTVLVGTGWQDICVRFHRAHPESCKFCLESDLVLSSGVEPGSFKAYRCKNSMWDAVTPIMLGSRHIGNIFLGQFFYDDEKPDREQFRAQARQYGYDEQAYLAALDRVPRWSRVTVQTAMRFYAHVAQMISSASFTHALLADAVRLGADTQHLRHLAGNQEQGADDPGRETFPVSGMKSPRTDEVESQSGQDFVRRFLRGWSLIRERTRASRAIEQAKQEWEQTFDAVPDLIAIVAPDHRILRVNRAMAHICGISPEQIVGKRCFELIHGTDRPPATCPHRRLLSEPGEYSEEIDEPRLNGVFDVTVSPLYRADGTLRGSVHVARNITRRKRAEQERERLEEQVRHAERLHSIGTLAGGVAHDFNNILTVIAGYTHIIQMGLPPDHPQQDNIRQIVDGTNRATHLIRDLLLFSRKTPVNRRHLDLRAVLHKAEYFLGRVIGSNIVLNVVSEPPAPLVIYGDEQQLGQVVMNLATNARDAMPDGGTITISIEVVALSEQESIALGLGKPDRYARIAIADTGTGIPPEKLPNIFDPFFTTKEPGKGTGLGLSIVYGIVKSHDGAIQATSVPDQGTTITIHLPLYNAAEGTGSGADL